MMECGGLQGKPGLLDKQRVLTVALVLGLLVAMVQEGFLAKPDGVYHIQAASLEGV